MGYPNFYELAFTYQQFGKNTNIGRVTLGSNIIRLGCNTYAAYF